MEGKNKIPAVFKEDLKKLLQSIDELESIEKGERLCKVCSKVVSLENIQLIIPRKDKTYDFICDSPVCVEEYNRKNELKK
ncbi:hypothetical protein ACFOWU_04145 [Epilithonimonas zeae]|uniref:Uncharacterized protein n=1 Tax=Epilithonimonas zeae TaxID=1416779 RepID=A0A1N6EVG3_9FLAO|nr:hypothetical protein [Epilithonimonas zeae]SIN86970.1 hypothetical protein SAMN05444409_0877 [Epilithonimonas zeae]